MMSATRVEFVEASLLRFKAIISLGSADIFLIDDNWWMFSLLLILAIFFEIMHLKLYEVLLHNHNVAEHNRKMHESRDHQNILADMRRQ